MALQTPEQRLIASIKEWSGAELIGDDCAILPGGALASSDTLVEGTHFDLSFVSLRSLGWKAVAVNLSDIAAMGGRPRHLLINLTLPADFDERRVRDLYQSMVECARAYRTDVVGGDITRGPLLCITVTVLGECSEAGCLRRTGAHTGDAVIVTGDFGASAAGLWALQHGIGRFDYCVNRHLRPSPRLAESWALVESASGRGSLMDASDGLGDALAQIAAQSRVGMTIDLSKVPIHQQTRELSAVAGVDALDWALYGGEDYELVGSMPAEVWQSWQKAAYNPFVIIGSVNGSGDVELRHPQRGAISLDLSKSFQHLSAT